MADSSVPITAGTGTPIRVLTALGAGSADQQVVTLADSAGVLLGTVSIPLPVMHAQASTGTLTAPAIAVTSFTVLAANSARRGAAFLNDGNGVLYLALAAAASTTLHTVQIGVDQYYELPAGSVYTGIVTAIGLTAVGNVRVTELS